MPAMNTTELTELLNDDAAARIEARTLANIARRARSLFSEDGYSALPIGLNSYCVFTPEGGTYAVFVSDTPEHELFGSHCSCPCFAARQTCKHLQAVVLSIEEGAEGDANRDAYDADDYRF